MAEGKPLSVIIIGGSVSGLTMAHMLDRINIEYILLERGPEIAFDGGASIGLQPHGLRIMDQLGMYEDICRMTVPMSVVRHRRPDSTVLSESRFSQQIESRHGYPILFFEREELLKILFNHLLNKSRVYCSKKVVEITSGKDCVTVKTADGDIYSADIVIGADGVHSFTRNAMWNLMRSTEPGLVQKESKAMSCEYACVFGVSEHESHDIELMPGNSHIIYHQHLSSIVIRSTRNKTFWFVIMKLDRKYIAPNVPRFTQMDGEAIVMKVADWKVTAATTLQDLWDKRTRFTMVPLEEAIYERWHEGRLVLLGDAVHKVTPNAGHGGNTAVESAATLSNLLSKASGGTGNLRLDYPSMISVFQEYQRDRQKRVQTACTMSSMATRLQALDSSLWKILGLHVVPFFGEEMEANGASELMIGGQPLDFVEYKGKSGTVPWEGWISSKIPFPYPEHILVKLMEKNGAATCILLATWIASECHGSALVSVRNAFGLKEYYESISTAPLRPWATVAACMNLIPIGVIIAVEALRRDNARQMTIIPLIAVLSLWFGGLSTLGILFIMAYAVERSLAPIKNPYSFIVQSNKAEALILATLCTILLIVTLPTRLPQLLWPVSYQIYQRKILPVVLQVIPVVPLILTELFARFNPVGDNTELLVHGHQDIGSLRAAYVISTVTSAMFHIVSTCYSLKSLFENYASITDFKLNSLIQLGLGGQFLSDHWQYSYTIFVIAAIMFVYLSSAAALPLRSQSVAFKLRLGLGVLFATALFGPGTAAGFLWIWREDKVRCDTIPPV